MTTKKEAVATETKKETANMKNTVHFILQGKGGIGKSFVSALLAEYIKTNFGTLAAFDTDQENTTFAHYKALSVKQIPVMTPSRTIDSKKFDALIVDIMETEEPCVIDNGANTFSPLLAYMIENDVFSMLKDAGKRVYIHSIIGGGDNLIDTANGFNSIIQGVGDVPVVLWLNEYFGSTDSNGKEFTETTLFKNNSTLISGVVTLVERNRDTFGDDIKRMLSQRLTVSEAIASDKFNIMEKQRIKTVARDVFNQLDSVEF
ncbi:P-loop NTPase family protein [Halomonas hibernica]|uniref:conjugal transfer protein TraL n=1 Tax=Halomonas hibernica TaxID=2591147 RepID=UPI001C12FB4D|nr:conjugal transfer protein TraL [Halomonas hibernica]